VASVPRRCRRQPEAGVAAEIKLHQTGLFKAGLFCSSSIVHQRIVAPGWDDFLIRFWNQLFAEVSDRGAHWLQTRQTDPWPKAVGSFEVCGPRPSLRSRGGLGQLAHDPEQVQWASGDAGGACAFSTHPPDGLKRNVRVQLPSIPWNEAFPAANKAAPCPGGATRLVPGPCRPGCCGWLTIAVLRFQRPRRLRFHLETSPLVLSSATRDIRSDQAPQLHQRSAGQIDHLAAPSRQVEAADQAQRPHRSAQQPVDRR